MEEFSLLCLSFNLVIKPSQNTHPTSQLRSSYDFALASTCSPAGHWGGLKAPALIVPRQLKSRTVDWTLGPGPSPRAGLFPLEQYPDGGLGGCG